MDALAARPWMMTPLAALSALASAAGAPRTAIALGDLVRPAEDPASPATLTRLAHRAGFAATTAGFEVAALRPGLAPLILIGSAAGKGGEAPPTADGQQDGVWAAVVHEIRLPGGSAAAGGRMELVLAAGDGGVPITARIEELVASSPTAIVVMRTQGLDYELGEDDADAVPRTAWAVMRRYRSGYVAALLAAAIANLLALMPSLLSMHVYDRIIPNQAGDTLIALVIGCALAVMFEGLLRHFRVHFVEAATGGADVALTSLLYARLIGARVASLARLGSPGQVASRVREFDNVRDALGSAVVLVFADLPFAAFFLLLMAIYAGWVAIAPLATGLAVIGAAVALQHRQRSVLRRLGRAAAVRQGTVVETAHQIETIKRCRAESLMTHRMAEAVQVAARESRKLRSLSAVQSALISTGQNVSLLIVLSLGALVAITGEMTGGALIACSFLSGRVVAAFSAVVGVVPKIAQARASLHELRDILDLPQEGAQAPDDEMPGRRGRRRAVALPSVRGDFVMRDVHFRYPGAEHSVLEGLGLEIRAGSRIAIIGPTGVGKSSIERLLTGLYVPTKGTITLDGIDLNALDPSDLRARVASVPQMPTLLSGTLRENLTLGRPIADARIVAALERLGAETLLRQGAGLDLEVGDGGARLSGGQRQLIAIARAMLIDAPVLVLDEPTASLDVTTEARVVGALAQHLAESERPRTLILISHRELPRQRLAEHACTLEGGRIVGVNPTRARPAAVAPTTTGPTPTPAMATGASR